MFEALSDRLTDIFGGLRGKVTLTERDVKLICRHMRSFLIERSVTAQCGTTPDRVRSRKRQVDTQEIETP